MTQPFGAEANKTRRQPQAICGNFSRSGVRLRHLWALCCHL